MALLKASAVRQEIKAGGKRASKEFLEAFERLVVEKLKACIATKNGSKKTLDADVANYVFGKLTK